MKLPSVSCVIATYNSSDTIKECLTSLFSQNYPMNKLEVIIVDVGSKAKTEEILKRFKVRIYQVAPKKQEAEYNKGTGILHAKKQLILLIE